MKNDERLTSGQQRNAEPLYNFPELKIVSNFVRKSSVWVSALRSLGAYANVFAIESFVDEIASENGVDPIEFRLQNLIDYRAKEILIAAVNAASSSCPVIREGCKVDRGVGLAQYKNLQAYVAIVCDLDINIKSGVVTIRHATIATDEEEIIR